MDASFLRLLGLPLVACAFFACASAQTAEPLYAQYALDPAEHPESVSCFYDCLRSTRPEFRDTCFARCDGVVATTTLTPCERGSPALCRGYEVPEDEPCDAEPDDQETAAQGFFGFLALVFDVASEVSENDGKHEQHEHSSSRSHAKRSRSSPSSTHWGSKSAVRDVSNEKSLAKPTNR